MFEVDDLRACYAYSQVGNARKFGTVTQHKAKTGTLPDVHENPATTARVRDGSKVVKRSAVWLSTCSGRGTRASIGVADGARTHDNRNHNPGLYQLSYSHR